MVLLSIFYTNQIHGGSSADYSLFILSLRALALHQQLKYYFKSFCMKIWARWPYTHHRLYFPPECQQDLLCFATNTVKVKTFLIFDINHQQNTRGSDQIETIKTIMQTTRPRITWKVLPMAQVAIFKEIFDQVPKRFRLWIVLFWTKTSQRLTLYLLSITDNIHIVLKTITPC